MKFRAPHRLRATSDQAIEVEAQFDKTKEIELRTLQKLLKNGGVIFKLDKHHLYHKTNPHDCVSEVQTVLKIVHDHGHVPNVRPGTLEQSRFSIKCTDDLIIQRLNNDLRVFFFVP